MRSDRGAKLDAIAAGRFAHAKALNEQICKALEFALDLVERKSLATSLRDSRSAVRGPRRRAMLRRMCGRYKLSAKHESVWEHFDIHGDVPFELVGKWAAVFASAVGCLACTSHSENLRPQTTTGTASLVQSKVAIATPAHRRRHRRGGVTLLVAMSLETLGLPHEKRAAVEEIRLDLHTRIHTALAANQVLVNTLADCLTAAAFDPSAVETAVSNAEASGLIVYEASTDALNRLHDVLTAADRAALLAQVESNLPVWQRVNAQENPADMAENGHLVALIANLGLTRAQANYIRSRTGDSLINTPESDAEDGAARLRGFEDAFLAEQFEAHSLTRASDVNMYLPFWGAQRLRRFIEVASLILNAKQRTSLAQRLRELPVQDPEACASGSP